VTPAAARELVERRFGERLKREHIEFEILHSAETGEHYLHFRYSKRVVVFFGADRDPELLRDEAEAAIDAVLS